MIEMHPEVAAVLQQAQRLQSVMDEQLAKMNTESFTATDEAKTDEANTDEAEHPGPADAGESAEAKPDSAPEPESEVKPEAQQQSESETKPSANG